MTSWRVLNSTGECKIRLTRQLGEYQIYLISTPVIRVIIFLIMLVHLKSAYSNIILTIGLRKGIEVVPHKNIRKKYFDILVLRPTVNCLFFFTVFYLLSYHGLMRSYYISSLYSRYNCGSQYAESNDRSAKR